jgi:Xaa-Pro dipeptidase
MDMSDRYADYREVAKKLGVEALALVPGPNFARLMHAHFGTNERPLVLVIPVEGQPAAIVPNLELSSFALLSFEGEVFDWRDQTGYQDAFEALAAHMPLGKVAAEGQVMRVFVHHALAAANPGIRIVDGEREISGLRIRKTPEEIAILEKAVQISEAALSDVIAKVRVGMSEKDVEILLTQALFAHGAESHAFNPIVVAADNSARAHGHARADYRIRKGDALLFDFGAAWGGFCADITRTFFVGEASQEARDVYATVLAKSRPAGHAVAVFCFAPARAPSPLVGAEATMKKQEALRTHQKGSKMPKMKTKSAAKKRFKITGDRQGSVRRRRQAPRHDQAFQQVHPRRPRHDGPG